MPASASTAARERGFSITQILNTHEHRDHTDGNAGVVAATRAKVLAHAGAASRIGGVDRGLGARRRDQGRAAPSSSKCSTRPATRARTCACCAHGDSPALFCGDTLFNAGAGNCHNGGDPGPALRDLRESARAAARCDARVSRATNTWRAISRSRSIASPAMPTPRRR